MSFKVGEFSGTIVHKAKNGVTEFVEFPIEEIDTIFERAQGMVNYYYVCVSFHYCGNGALLVSVSRGWSVIIQLCRRAEIQEHRITSIIEIGREY